MSPSSPSPSEQVCEQDCEHWFAGQAGQSGQLGQATQLGQGVQGAHGLAWGHDEGQFVGGHLNAPTSGLLLSLGAIGLSSLKYFKHSSGMSLVLALKMCVSGLQSSPIAL